MKPRNSGKEPSSRFPMPIQEVDIYHDPNSRKYFMRNEKAHFIPARKVAVTRYLKFLGFSPKPWKEGGISPVESALAYVEINGSIDYAGPLAGYPVGLRTIGDKHILVTKEPRLIKPEPGKWSHLRAFLEGMLGTHQSGVFYGWLQCAFTALYESRFLPGQALVLVGPSGCGKSLLQSLITEMFGGIVRLPFAYMGGRAPINRELLAATHLMVTGETAVLTHRRKAAFAALLREFTCEEFHHFSLTGSRKITLNPIWRVSISMGDYPHALQTFPFTHGCLADCVIILKADHTKIPLLGGTRKDRWSLLAGEVPAFVHWIRTEYTIPEDMRDSHFGIATFHEPSLWSQVG